MTISETILDVKVLTKQFGGLTALDKLSFQVSKGEMLGLIGPNGSGKTTFFNVLTGLFPPSSGDVYFRGKSLRGFPVHRINLEGIARTFQNLKIFQRMTVWENIMVASLGRMENARWKDVMCLPASLREKREAEEEAWRIIEFVGLKRFADLEADSLAYGYKRRLEIGRALATKPSLLLLDEPAAGMNTQETESLLELLDRLRHSGLTLIVIEHDMRLIMGISSRIIVLNHGKLLAMGTPESVRANPEVIEAYLGKETSYA